MKSVPVPILLFATLLSGAAAHGDHDSGVCPTCTWTGTAIQVTHTSEGLADYHTCFHNGDACVCECQKKIVDPSLDGCLESGLYHEFNLKSNHGHVEGVTFSCAESSNIGARCSIQHYEGEEGHDDHDHDHRRLTAADHDEDHDHDHDHDEDHDHDSDHNGIPEDEFSNWQCFTGVPSKTWLKTNHIHTQASVAGPEDHDHDEHDHRRLAEDTHVEDHDYEHDEGHDREHDEDHAEDHDEDHDEDHSGPITCIRTHGDHDEHLFVWKEWCAAASGCQELSLEAARAAYSTCGTHQEHSPSHYDADGNHLRRI